jgi:hypothetical protein
MRNLYKILFILFSCIGAVPNALAQNQMPFGCATNMEDENSISTFSSLNGPVYSGSYDLPHLDDYPPISFKIHFWIINRTDGSGNWNVTEQDIQTNMGILNDMYRPMGICFTLNGYGNINNTSIYENTSLGSIVNYATQNGFVVPNCFNVYLPRTLTRGHGITNFGSDKLVVTQSVMLGTFGHMRGHALAHELAHDFGLYHPWGSDNGTIITAEHVTRDPSDPNYNALTTADGIHDTNAMVSFWDEATADGVPIEDIVDTDNCEYLGDLTDNLGIPFSLTRADVGNPMGYTFESCETGFSVGQGIRIREYIDGSPSMPSVRAMTSNVCKNCSENLIISLPITYSESFNVSNNITASSLIYENTQVIYSGREIILQPGFDISGTDMGSFTAKINPCDLNSGSRYAKPESNLSSNNESAIKDNAGSVIYIAPNPAHSLITIAGTEEINSILITSLDGKILFAGTPNGKVTTMHVAVDAYSNGIYNIVVITADGKKQIKKFIKN